MIQILIVTISDVKFFVVVVFCFSVSRFAMSEYLAGLLKPTQFLGITNAQQG